MMIIMMVLFRALYTLALLWPPEVLCIPIKFLFERTQRPSPFALYGQSSHLSPMNFCHPYEYLFRFLTSMTPYSFKQSMYRGGNIDLQYITQRNRRMQYAPYHSVAYGTLLNFGPPCLPAPASFPLSNVMASSHHLLRPRFRYTFFFVNHYSYSYYGI